MPSLDLSPAIVPLRELRCRACCRASGGAGQFPGGDKRMCAEGLAQHSDQGSFRGPLGPGSQCRPNAALVLDRGRGRATRIADSVEEGVPR
jgi:hypothetical protein